MRALGFLALPGGSRQSSGGAIGLWRRELAPRAHEWGRIRLTDRWQPATLRGIGNGVLARAVAYRY
jgi:hypothetical protein